MPAADHVDHRRALGIGGKEIAAAHLRTAGMLILDRNWRPQSSEAVGEVDLIARDGDALVIVEVKTRRSLAFGAPVEAVTRRKIRQLRSLALAWLDERSIHAPALRWSTEGMSLDDIAVRSGVSGSQARTCLAQAEEMGLVQQRGQDRWVYAPSDGAHGRA